MARRLCRWLFLAIFILPLAAHAGDRTKFVLNGELSEDIAEFGFSANKKARNGQEVVTSVFSHVLGVSRGAKVMFWRPGGVTATAKLIGARISINEMCGDAPTVEAIFEPQKAQYVGASPEIGFIGGHSWDEVRFLKGVTLSSANSSKLDLRLKSELKALRENRAYATQTVRSWSKAAAPGMIRDERERWGGNSKYLKGSFVALKEGLALYVETPGAASDNGVRPAGVIGVFTSGYVELRTWLGFLAAFEYQGQTYLLCSLFSEFNRPVVLLRVDVDGLKDLGQSYLDCGP